MSLKPLFASCFTAGVLMTGTALSAPAQACLSCGIKLNGISLNGFSLNGIGLQGLPVLGFIDSCVPAGRPTAVTLPGGARLALR
ncbi:MAG: hypothetical protein JWQ90_5399 [Hydrocarboniphaga sp.]|uniref:hypothetical protein n=1 Tax=Hydrocarboniphaga sp. TaxID=2033016 RepID=UPI0026199DD1|nr:hypothetical protein [Hydrocarboniphaga sp.]MDB5972949.1 hypothetical protein [Hydrocarboniphaga sp.]